MSIQMVTRSPQSDKPDPMLDSSRRYRIAHVASEQYWAGATWATKQEARIYSAAEREVKTLPHNGCWEEIAGEVDPAPDRAAVAQPFDRSLVATAIAQLLLSQWCKEERVPLQRLADLEPAEAARFREAGEVVTQLVLAPDLRDTALMAAADVLCGQFSGQSIHTHHRQAQQWYFDAAVSAWAAMKATLRFRSVDSRGDDEYCRLVDAIAPKAGIR